ncbi:MAG: hypothetical protein M5U34_16365 [Chloroflexi bacterium]|nr:hypothetical protein [Chloroflexota bacterium]
MGQVRDHNEDFVINHEPADAAEAAENGWLYIVADGVGGADAGEIASKFAAEKTVHHYLHTSPTRKLGAAPCRRHASCQHGFAAYGGRTQ